MGFIDSVFGSSSKSSNKSTTTYNTTTTTTSNTTSNMRDVGLTGQAAVSLADVITDTGHRITNNANVYNSKNFDRLLRSLDSVNQTTALNQDKASDFANRLLDTAVNFSSNLTSTARGTGSEILTASEGLTQTENKNLVPVILIGIVGLVFALKGLN